VIPQDKYLEHLAAAGRKGGNAGTEKQKKTRTLNLWRGLAKRWPLSSTVQQKLRELEAMSLEEPDGKR
jgi:hypothetical protein